MFSKNLEALKDDILETPFIYVEMSDALLVSTDLEMCFFQSNCSFKNHTVFWNYILE